MKSRRWPSMRLDSLLWLSRFNVDWWTGRTNGRWENIDPHLKLSLKINSVPVISQNLLSQITKTTQKDR